MKKIEDRDRRAELIVLKTGHLHRKLGHVPESKFGQGRGIERGDRDHFDEA